jgi:hypothetical protein
VNYVAGHDAFVTKLDPSGNIEWNAFLGGSGDDEATSVAVDGGGNSYLSGNSGSAWGCSPSTCTMRAYSWGTDAFVAKLSESGDLSWNAFLGGNEEDTGERLLVDEAGTAHVVGSSASSWGAPQHAYTAGRDLFVAGLDALGALTWNTFFGGSGDDSAIDLDLDNQAIRLWQDSHLRPGSPLHGYAGGSAMFVGELPPSGDLAWNTFWRGQNDNGRAVSRCSGNVYCPLDTTAYHGPDIP